MLLFLSLLDRQIDHTQIQSLLLKVSQLYQLPHPLLCMTCPTPYRWQRQPPGAQPARSWLPFADPLLQTAHCKLSGLSSALQFLFPHPIPHFLTFACFRVWKELM